MEETNLSFILGETSPSNISSTLNPPYSIPSTNALTTPFVGAIISAPMETSMPTIQNSLFPPLNPPYQQSVMGSSHTAPTRIEFTPTSSLSSFLHSNKLTTSVGHFPTTNYIPITTDSFNTPSTHFPTINHIPKTINSSNTPLSLFQSPNLPTQNSRHIYNVQMEPHLKSHLQPLLLSTNLTLGSQASYNNGYKLSNPYFMNANPNYFYSMGNTTVDITSNQDPLFRDTSRAFRCSTCRVEFPTAQAYGGHMSSHSKAKKAKERLEASVREAKRAKLARNAYPFFDLSAKRTNISLVMREKMEEIPKEGDVTVKGKSIMRQPIKEIEKIQMEIPDYLNDDSVNNELYLH